MASVMVGQICTAVVVPTVLLTRVAGMKTVVAAGVEVGGRRIKAGTEKGGQELRVLVCFRESLREATMQPQSRPSWFG